MENEVPKYVDLLIICVDGEDYVVEASTSELSTGDMVEILVAGENKIGTVACEPIFVEQHGEKYEWIYRLSEIYPVKRAWRKVDT